jgi:uncharacterized SAM-binding protein YcdF (DUF218 family)
MLIKMKKIKLFKQHKNISIILIMSLGISISSLLFLLGIIYIKLIIAKHQAPEPQAILVLGGGENREEFAAKFAQKHPTLEIWVSRAKRPNLVKAFEEANISPRRVIFEWRAVDTVANFTYNLKHLQSNHVKHIYLITSKDHMPRAKIIATLILGSQGITFTPIEVPANKKLESLFILRTVSDFFNALIWIFTGYESPPGNPGANSPKFNPNNQ